MNLPYLLPPLIASAISAALLAVVLTHRQKKQSHWLLILLLTSTTVWGLAIYAMRSSPDVAHALFWDRLVLGFIGATLPVLFYRFSLTLRRSEKQKLLLRAGYVFSVLSLLIAPTTSLVVERMTIESYGYAPIFNTGGYVIFGIAYVLSAMAIYNLIKAYRASEVYEEKNRLLLITLAMFCPLFGGIFELFPIVYPTAIFGNILFGVLASVALLRYHLLDVELIIRKGIAYFIISALVAVPYVVIIFSATNLLGLGANSPWIYIPLAAILAMAFQPLWSQMQRLVDKWFFRQRHDFLKALEDFSQETHAISDIKRLGSSLVDLIMQALQSSGAYLLLASGTGDFSILSSAGKVTSQLTLESSSPIVQKLQPSPGILYRRDLITLPQFQALTKKQVDEFEAIQAQLFIPVLTKQRMLVGILILGQKLSEQPYSKEEERLVLSVVSRIAVELENARLFDSERALRKNLEIQNELKTEFLHSLAHELKTPLTALLSSATLLSEEPTMPTDLRDKMITNIKRSAQSMDRRVSELLNLARMQIETLELQQEPLEITTLLADVTSQFRILFENRQQILSLKMPDSLPLVRADREKLEEVFFNLLSNANKYSPNGGEITLRAKEEDGKIVVTVEDSAPLITDEEKKRLFEPYYRGEDTAKRKRAPGLGLGLHITRRLVELHHGKIWVDSNPLKGNIFTLSLPSLEPEPEGVTNP